MRVWGLGVWDWGLGTGRKKPHAKAPREEGNLRPTVSVEEAALTGTVFPQSCFPQWKAVY